MKQAVINFQDAGMVAQQATTGNMMARAIEYLTSKKSKALSWYMGVSPFWSKMIAEEKGEVVSRRAVVLANLIMVAFILAAGSVENDMLLAFFFVAVMGALVNQLNKEDERLKKLSNMGGVKSNSQKGGIA